MFKKLALLVLVTGSTYAMESLPTTPTGESDVKQLTEEVKQTSEDNKKTNEIINNKVNTNDIEEQFDNLNIDETLRQMNSINDKKVNDGNSNKANNKVRNKNNAKRTNKNRINMYNNEIRDNSNLNKNRINLFNKEARHNKDDNPNKIIDDTINTNNIPKDFKNLKINEINTNPNGINFWNDKTEIDLSDNDELNTAVILPGADEVDKLINSISDKELSFEMNFHENNKTKDDIYNKFSQLCQRFLRRITNEHKITEQLLLSFCNSEAFYNCVEIGFDPLVILEGVYKANVKMLGTRKPDVSFLEGQMLYLSRQIPPHIGKVKWHQSGIRNLQQQLKISTDEASQIYWDNYWSNYSLLGN